jgi:hypothetical protein
MRRFLRNNGLSLVMFGLFAVFLLAQSVTGMRAHNQEQAEHDQPEIGYLDYVQSGDFIESTFENWESEFLQMAAFVVLAAIFYQRGSGESKHPDEHNQVDDDPRIHRQADSPAPVHRGGLALTLYSHSLTIALTVLFLISFVLHAIGGQRLHNQEQLAHGESAVSLVAFMGTSQFWFESFQNWQSEFLSVGVLVVLSIFLRQKGSPESKPVHAPHHENEPA